MGEEHCIFKEEKCVCKNYRKDLYVPQPAARCKMDKLWLDQLFLLDGTAAPTDGGQRYVTATKEQENSG